MYLVPNLSIDRLDRPIPLGSDTEQRLLSDLKSYQAIAVQRQLNRQGALLLAVRVTIACEALPCQVKGGFQVFEVTPYAARVRRCARCQKLSRTAKHCRQTTQTCRGCGGRGHWREGCGALPLAQTARAHMGCPEHRTRLLVNKIEAQTYMPYNHAIRQAKQILPNHTDNMANNRPKHTVPPHHTQTTLKIKNKHQHKKHSATQTWLGMVGNNTSQTKTTQTTPKQKQVRTTQASASCREQGQTVNTLQWARR